VNKGADDVEGADIDDNSGSKTHTESLGQIGAGAGAGVNPEFSAGDGTRLGSTTFSGGAI